MQRAATCVSLSPSPRINGMRVRPGQILVGTIFALSCGGMAVWYATDAIKPDGAVTKSGAVINGGLGFFFNSGGLGFYYSKPCGGVLCVVEGRER